MMDEDSQALLFPHKDHLYLPVSTSKDKLLEAYRLYGIHLTETKPFCYVLVKDEKQHQVFTIGKIENPETLLASLRKLKNVLILIDPTMKLDSTRKRYVCSFTPLFVK